MLSLHCKDRKFSPGIEFIPYMAVIHVPSSHHVKTFIAKIMWDFLITLGYQKFLHGLGGPGSDIIIRIRSTISLLHRRAQKSISRYAC